MKIVLELKDLDQDLLKEIDNAEPGSVETIDVLKFGGDIDTVSAIVYLSAVTIPVIGKIIIELIQSKRYVKLKVKGVEISGISEKNVQPILQNILKKGNDNKK